ncbi:PAS domain S-box-containing protein [Neorhizobium huautlense]|uniref:histidine kinase n=1 Tax=Neorhizobium huautlense TaxID=67774 RepID=A0ABT9Q1S5_9HYPH|nr:PAS domain-containing sensor histidine kinase [Neorhizobium huautlense]MDP9840637.1 PAS domain S-box-containing protein [Neorhizobium huautlense]
MQGFDLLKGLADAFSFENRRDADKFLQAIVDTTPECIKVVAPNGDLLHMNAAGLTMIETDSWDRVAGACTFNLVADEYRAQWLEHHAKVCGGERLVWEFDIIGLAGTRRHMETHAVPIKLDDGTTGQLAITRDVSARRQAEEALLQAKEELEDRVRDRTHRLQQTLQKLQESERNFGLIVNSVSDYAICMLDHQGNVTSWNSGAERILGYTSEEIVGENFSRFYNEDDRATGLPCRSIETALEVGRFENEGWRLRKDGSRFFANDIIDAVYDNGALVGFAKVTRDITEKRRAEALLRQAQKMEAVGQFTGGAAHDFNNLLMAILGSLELLQKRLPQEDTRAKALLENAVHGARRGASLTQRMLAFARRQDLQQEAVDLVTLVSGAKELLDQAVGPAITIETHLPRTLPPTKSDPVQLETALLNLVVNARDAMPNGGTVEISVHLATLALHEVDHLPAGDYLCLSVRDNGEGMDETTLSRVMEPFFTTKGVGKGTGLGLPMVDGLAAQSGGKLRLLSIPGTGTTAEIWLPVAREYAPSPAPVPSVELTQELPQPALTILAVDDDALVLMNTAAMLEDLGHRVLEASSGQQALRILENGERVDLLVTDQAMPGMTGVELAKLAKALQPNLSVVLATGYAELPAGEETSLQKLSKPFMQAELATAVSKALQL